MSEPWSEGTPRAGTNVQEALEVQRRLFNDGLREAIRVTRRQFDEVNRMVAEQLSLSQQTMSGEAVAPGAGAAPIPTPQPEEFFRQAESLMGQVPPDPLQDPEGFAAAQRPPAFGAGSSTSDPMIYAKQMMDEASKALHSSLDALLVSLTSRGEP